MLDNNLDHEHHHHHEHDHEHSHSHAESASTLEEKIALLEYMLHHNEHHAEELHELGHSLDAQAADLIHEAVHLFDHGNEKLSEALKLLKGDK